MRTPTTTSVRKWWNAKSELFSMLGGGDTYTHGEVVLAHLFFVLLIIACGLAGMLEGGAL